jgi:NTP pyrophosphatase (non-canonical NTP hydrolase)
MSKEPFNGLTNKQAELLAMLVEEANEVGHIVAKILRHGLKSFNPNDPDAGTNKTQLSRELGDLIGVMAAVDEAGLIFDQVVSHYASNKMERATPYLHHQGD